MVGNGHDHGPAQLILCPEYKRVLVSLVAFPWLMEAFLHVLCHMALYDLPVFLSLSTASFVANGSTFASTSKSSPSELESNIYKTVFFFCASPLVSNA